MLYTYIEILHLSLSGGNSLLCVCHVLMVVMHVTDPSYFILLFLFFVRHSFFHTWSIIIYVFFLLCFCSFFFLCSLQHKSRHLQIVWIHNTHIIFHVFFFFRIPTCIPTTMTIDCHLMCVWHNSSIVFFPCIDSFLFLCFLFIFYFFVSASTTNRIQLQQPPIYSFMH